MRGLLIFALIVFMLAAVGCLGSNNSGDQASRGIVETSLPVDVLATTTTLAAAPEPEIFDVSEVDYSNLLNDKYATCLKCHGDVKFFHTAEIISELDQQKGLTPRLCIVCHGTKVHEIHWDMLNEKYIACGTCHRRNGEFFTPATREGQLLVCELCHSNGNYVQIHIEGNVLEDAPIDDEWIRTGTPHQCDTCHIGDYDTIHYSPLTAWKEGINSAVKEVAENPPDPLNISYL